MSLRPEGPGTDRPITVLHVDDDPAFAGLVKTYLEREDDAFTVLTETDPTEVQETLRALDVDCVVSDYDMPRVDGLALLGRIRSPFPDMPFILFTGKGSEGIASDAISQGVTDYLQKGGGIEQYEVLAHRIRRCVDRFRTEHELERSRAFVDRVLDLIPEAVFVVEGTGQLVRANERALGVLGCSPPGRDVLTDGGDGWQLVDDDGRPVGQDGSPFESTSGAGTRMSGVNCGVRRPDGQTVWFSANAAPLATGEDRSHHVVAVLSGDRSGTVDGATPATEVGQLERFGEVLSHDLGNALTIADGRLQLAHETGADEQFDAAVESLARAEGMLESLTTAMRAGSLVDGLSTVEVGAVLEAAWETQQTEHATMVVDSDVRIRADESALLRLVENLVRNSFEHGEDASTVRLGELPDGFYLEDDGTGIPEAERTQVFEPGYTTKEGGTGIGLVSIQQIALAHGWQTRVTESGGGGARFEFTGIERPAPTPN